MKTSLGDTEGEDLHVSRKLGKLFFGEQLCRSRSATEDVVVLGSADTSILESVGATRRRRSRKREGSEEAFGDFSNNFVIIFYIDSERSRSGTGAKLRAAT